MKYAKVIKNIYIRLQKTYICILKKWFTWTFVAISIGLSLTKFLSIANEIFFVKDIFSEPVRNKEWFIFGTMARITTQFGSISVMQNKGW